MYKMLIVDDNIRDREGLTTILDWSSMDIDIIGMCSNGEQALEAVGKSSPDIILTDILMPVMNGIEMAGRLKEVKPDTKIIFMSCYNEFDFAKSAVSLDIEYYVLKPVMPEELEEAVLKALNKHKALVEGNNEKQNMLRIMNESIPKLRDQFFRQLIFGFYKNPEDIQHNMAFLKCGVAEDTDIQIATIVISEYEQLSSAMNVTDRYITAFSISTIIEEFSTGHLHINIVQLSENKFALVLFKDSIHGDMGESEILETVVSIKNAISSGLGMKCVIGISRNSRDIMEIPLLYKQSLTAAETKYYSDNDQIIFYKDVEDIDRSQFEQTVDLQMLYREIKELLSSVDDEASGRFLDCYMGAREVKFSENYIRSFLSSTVNILQILLIEGNKSFQNIFDDDVVIWDKISRFDTIKDVRQWLYNIINSVREHLYGTNNDQYSKIAGAIREIVRNRYREQLSVNDIAKLVFLSPSHANNIFKKMEGKTIFDYLLEYRMEMARKLLKEPGSRIYAVAESVGYTNISHFCLIFKKFTGFSPNEFKNKAEK